MFRNMAASLLRHETIRTTVPKAKELRRVVEPLITLAKEDSAANRRRAFVAAARRRGRGQAVHELGPRFKARPGGYMRILKWASAPATTPRWRSCSWSTSPLPPRSEGRRTTKARRRGAKKKTAAPESEALSPMPAQEAPRAAPEEDCSRLMAQAGHATGSRGTPGFFFPAGRLSSAGSRANAHGHPRFSGRSRRMSVIQEFKEFAIKGNVVDMAVGVVIGGAFGKIVSSLVDDVVMPAIGKVVGGVDFSKLALRIGTARPARRAVKYGVFLQDDFDFVIIAAAIFMAIKAINRLKTPPPPAAPAGDAGERVLLTEIRDLLKK